MNTAGFQSSAGEFDDLDFFDEPKVEVIPIRWIVPNRRLYTRQEIVSRFCEGQKFSPLIVNGAGELLDGHKRLAVFRRLNLEGVSVIIDYKAPIVGDSCP